MTFSSSQRIPLSKDERVRYSRHLALPEVGVEGQQRLKAARVLCVGVGGLGSSCALYLAAAGVGTLGLVDPDRVDASNLHRQILFAEPDVGKRKVDVAQQRLQALNPHIHIPIYADLLNEANALDLIQQYDVVVDGSDNFATRYVVNDACATLHKPQVYASIFQFEGQLSVFHADTGPCYRCLYPEAPPIDLIPNCAQGGVLGVLPGMMGSLQATETIKYITRIGKPMIGRLLTVDARTLQFNEYAVQKNPHCLLCHHHADFYALPRPQAGCEFTLSALENDEITVQELVLMIAQKTDFLLLDVREPFEYDICNLSGKLIPLSTLSSRLQELDPQQLIIVHCTTGGRGRKAAALLKQRGFHAKNLEGGILAWAKEVDSTL